LTSEPGGRADGAVMCRRAVRDDLADVGPAIEWAGRLAAALDPDVRFAVEVCLEEGLANLILHGRAPKGEKDIVLAFTGDALGARIEISDRCAPFDVAQAAPVADADDPLREGGRGLMLLRAFASELSYETQGGRNRLTLTFRAP
jgi:anti-sigma regulatory factor (Ser/Thr protein kinase)